MGAQVLKRSDLHDFRFVPSDACRIANLFSEQRLGKGRGVGYCPAAGVSLILAYDAVTLMAFVLARDNYRAAKVDHSGLRWGVNDSCGGFP